MNRQSRPLRTHAALAVLALGILGYEAAAAGAAPFAHRLQAEDGTSGQSESGTEGLREDEPGPQGESGQEGGRAGDREDDGEPPGFGGCIFEERPLELLV